MLRRERLHAITLRFQAAFQASENTPFELVRFNSTIQREKADYVDAHTLDQPIFCSMITISGNSAQVKCRKAGNLVDRMGNPVYETEDGNGILFVYAILNLTDENESGRKFRRPEFWK